MSCPDTLVRIVDMKEKWWVTVVYMGVEGLENLQKNAKLFEALLDTGREVEKRQ